MAVTNYEQLKQDYLGTDTSTGLADQLYKNYLTTGQDATAQAYALKRKQQQDAERDFYNQLYDTNATVLDTIRRNNAAAIASGASKGAQAANELSTILQGQQASVDAATQLAQSNYDLASEEAEAYITAEQAARQQADTAAGALAGNLAVAAQADAAVKAADINAETVTKTSEVYQLQDAVKKYLDPNADETTKTTNRLIIEALTGQTLNDLGFKTTTTETVDSNKKDVDTTVTKYDTIINNAAHPTVAKQYIEQAINSYNETGGNRVTNVIGKSGTDITLGYQCKISYGDKEYKLYINGTKQIKYDDIINDTLKAVVNEAPNGEPIKIDNKWYLVDKEGNGDRGIILQPINTGAHSAYNFNKDFAQEGGKYSSSIYNFTNKKNN